MLYVKQFVVVDEQMHAPCIRNCINNYSYMAVVFYRLHKNGAKSFWIWPPFVGNVTKLKNGSFFL